MPQTSSGGAQRVNKLDELEVIVDADSHVSENFDDLLTHMDDQYSGIRELMRQSEMPLNEVFSVTIPTPSFPSPEGHDPFSGMASVEKKVEQMDEHGIDYSIIDPTLSSELNSVNNSRFAVALANAYNSYILDTFGDRDDRIKITITVAPHKPRKAADEIDDRAAESNIVGVHIPPAGLVPPAGHETYYPIYEAAERHGLPIVMHAVVGCTHLSFPVQHKWSETFALEHAIFHPFQHMWNVSSLLYEGVPERFQDLDFVIQESGIGWVPYLKWRLDDHYMDMAHEIPALEKLPSKYIEENFYFTTQPLGMTQNGEHMAQAIDMVGTDNILYSSDIPHPDFDPPAELFDRIRGHFDGETVNEIMGGNAKRVYGF